MALDFPATPSTGQTFTGPNGVIWQYDGAKWVAGTAAGAYAPVQSPAFSGNPTAPTPPAGDADTSLATTAFVAASTAGALANVGRNLIHNSMFNLSQRGAGGWSTGNSYTADRWLLNFNAGNDSSTITRNAAVDATRTAIGDEDVGYILSNVFTGSAITAGFCQFVQRIEGVRRLAGKTITVSFWAAAAATVKIGVNFLRIYGTGGTPTGGDWAFATGSSVTLSTAWARYSMTFVMPSVAGKMLGTNGDDYTALTFWFSASTQNNAVAGNIGVQSGNVSIWGVQLEVGSTATPLEKLDPMTQLQQCQRFYQTGYANLAGYLNVGNSASTIYAFPVPMRGSVNFTSTFSQQVNCSGSGVTAYGTTHYQVYTNGSGLGGYACSGTFTASADL